MGITACLNVENEDVLGCIQAFLAAILDREDIEAVLVPKRMSKQTQGGHAIMPVLVNDPKELAGVDPLSPAFALNAARQVSKLTKKSSGKKIAALLRPCEIRALIELSKLKQADLSSVITISVDCPGAYSNKVWAEQSKSRDAADVLGFFDKRFNSRELTEDLPMATACEVCDDPVSEGADIQIGLVGMDFRKQLFIKSQSTAGEEALSSLSLDSCKEPAARSPELDEFISRRVEKRDRMVEDTREKTSSLDKLEHYFEACVNCYNCRVACPVCYCRECVFNTDVFDHDPFQYLVWARRKGAIKLPTDTLFFHLTRLAHMSLSCVGCGQCSNACPNDIPVMELFKVVAAGAQSAFDYQAGKDPDQALPLSEFKENEFLDVVGI